MATPTYSVPQIGSLAVATGASLVKFKDKRVWSLTNTDTNETIAGDYEATNVTRNVSANYARHSSLNQAKPITQFISGEADRISFTARLFQTNIFDDITTQFKTLVTWVNRDAKLRRPPILLFQVGDGDDVYLGDAKLVVMEALSNVQYDSPTFLGSVRGITFNVELVEYTEFRISNEAPARTRYARVKRGEYMELLAVREYRDPMLGEVVRQENPRLQVLEEGDVVPLPSFEAIRSISVEPRSISLSTLTQVKDSPQKTLRAFYFDKNNASFQSLIVPAGV